MSVSPITFCIAMIKNGAAEREVVSMIFIILVQQYYVSRNQLVQFQVQIMSLGCFVFVYRTQRNYDYLNDKGLFT